MQIKEIESFLEQIKSVISCKVIVDKEDNIEEIHILSDINRSPKQVSRDIQSGLISKFGIDIDHKKISIAQIDEKSVAERNFRLKIKTIEYTTSGYKGKVKVVLEKDEELFIGETSGPNTKYNSQRMIASATLKAVEKFLSIENNLILEDIKITSLAGREVVVTAISFISDYGEQLFSGCSIVNRDIKEAVVKSTLDAINRRIVKHHC
ncbi:hypothetical protein [Caldisalinibacter kiritimatiensis]|uniref:2-isopropylmalate synthase n=1 Tax=Caldisalinibacter kiritimatiensis TaxID=1304284 RepID=R1CLS7_9FIRM|nr:hypothetical protein [Caldisalinibacter kiritimatiensis]EOC99660.1 hypothetical protein L21TH_2303 [Caldisalinibacter kiritimatiensis]